MKNIKVIKKDMAKKEIVNKDYQLINARYKLSTIQMKIVLKVISLIHNKNDTEFLTYQIPLSHFDFLTDNGNYSRLKKEAKTIMEKVLEIETEKGWLLVHWFSDFEYNSEDSLIECSISYKLKPYLLQLKKKFKPYEIKYVMSMDSEYAMRIYELLKQYEKFGKREFEISELHEMMQVPVSFKKRYPDFRVNVLDTAKREINKHSDIEIDYEAKKRGRAVFWIEFTIEKNEKNIIESEALENSIVYDEIKHKEFKILFKRFEFEDKLFDEEFRNFCLYNNDKEEKVTIDNFKKWCMQKKRKGIEQAEKAQKTEAQQEKADYKWNFKKAKDTSDKLKNWLEFDLAINWMETYYWKDIHEFEIKGKDRTLKLSWRKVPHPTFNKDEILLFVVKEDDDNEESKYLLAQKQVKADEDITDAEIVE